MSLLKLEDVHVYVEQKEVIKGVNLKVERGEVHVLLGPNGSGKSTLLRAIMGLPGYGVTRGKILFEGRDLDPLKPYERARLGIALMHQNPKPISVKLQQVIKELCKRYGAPQDLVQRLGVNGLMDRELFKGFSGGEIKRVELALTILQKPKLAMLDEPDSGVDLGNLKLVGEAINSLAIEGTSILLVTHTGVIADYLNKVDFTHVIVDGRIVASGELWEMLDLIREKGYQAFMGWTS